MLVIDALSRAANNEIVLLNNKMSGMLPIFIYIARIYTLNLLLFNQSSRETLSLSEERCERCKKSPGRGTKNTRSSRSYIDQTISELILRKVQGHLDKIKRKALLAPGTVAASDGLGVMEERARPTGGFGAPAGLAVGAVVGGMEASGVRSPSSFHLWV